jgi:hypothetical protein
MILEKEIQEQKKAWDETLVILSEQKKTFNESLARVSEESLSKDKMNKIKLRELHQANEQLEALHGQREIAHTEELQKIRSELR